MNLDIEGTSLTDEDKFVITNKHVGGIIFFSRNLREKSACFIKNHFDKILSALAEFETII